MDHHARWQSPETLRAIFDQLSDGVFFFDKNLHLVGLNKGGEKMLGLSADEMLGLIRAASKVIPKERLWVNPDCGLKTRRWEEVKPALQNLVAAARTARTKT